MRNLTLLATLAMALSLMACQSVRTIIGRSKRDYLWLMSRKPTLAEAEQDEMVQIAAGAGDNPAQIRQVPQRWPKS